MEKVFSHLNFYLRPAGRKEAYLKEVLHLSFYNIVSPFSLVSHRGKEKLKMLDGQLIFLLTSFFK